MKSFIKQVFASAIGHFLAMAWIFGIGFFLIIYAISSIVDTVDFDIEATQKTTGILVLDMSTNINDAPSSQDGINMLIEQLDPSRTPTLYLWETSEAIRKAANDEDIKGLHIEGSWQPERYGSGYAALQELREAILEFKASGKPIYAYLNNAYKKDYFIASTADEIHLNPLGSLNILGLSIEYTFFGDAFKKYGIGVQPIRAGKYKSAIEPFTENKMSPANREQTEALLKSLWNNYIDTIAQNRPVNAQALEASVDQFGMFTAEEALKAQWVDNLSYADEVHKEWIAIAGKDPKHKSFKQISIHQYIQNQHTHPFAKQSSKKTIAIVYAEGAIMDNNVDGTQIDSKKLARKITQYKNDKNVAAIVLRVNSPGGSVTASERIQRALVEAQKEKPLIASFGSYAASGGYWIAASADQIFAEAKTITGSIGVYGMLFNFQELANTHGITWDHSKTSAFANLNSLSKPKSEVEIALIQKFVDQAYDTFLDKVSAGRKMERTKAETLGQGRVWTGEQAKKNGLVDTIGGLKEAIHAAAEAANLGDDWELSHYPSKKGFNEWFGASFSFGASEHKKIASILPQADQLSQTLQWLYGLNDARSIHAYMPYIMYIE